MADIQVYDEKRKCPKCGHGVVKTQYVPFHSVGCRVICPDGEHLHRTCDKCGYAWAEYCLDQAPVEPPLPDH